MSLNENKELTISGTLSFDDFKKYNYHVKKKAELYYFILITLIFLLLLNLFSPDLSLGYTVFLALLVAVIVELIRWAIRYLRIKKEFTSDRMIKNEIIYTISPDGIQQQRNRTNVHIDWKDILFIKEHKELFRIHLSKNKAIVLPKGFFPSEEDLHTFKEIISQNIN
ncbi:YcxB family protein [Neobacillus sp. PS2-9]|uniref:YcxB family protein n=1 Tax=Neobacillus sp. PS2-9 TaxID=3070676 RepID=UPI0027E10ACB|nr:YcxB family protein [Neobacillus sp. PS2-9]WML58834.1 YcxB family protein [Neobacillus sp. PS2-9]